MDLKAVCFGEVLWDIFPTHRKIGGAPLNVALRLQSLGVNTNIISKVGKDQEGDDLVDYIEKNAVSADHIQKDENHETGKVTVLLDQNGSATYEINQPAAWDKINISSDLETLVKNADVFIFGSLSCRDILSRTTLYQLVKNSIFNVFDVNLRAPYYTNKVLLDLMNACDFIKFNDEEIIEISKFNNLKHNSLEENIKVISVFTNTNKICVTRGADGAVLYLNDTFYYNEGIQVNVVDTVGAGDSFLAALISKLLVNEDAQVALDYACAVGSIVASKEGANAIISEEEIKSILSG
jgi:fructokinase